MERNRVHKLDLMFKSVMNRQTNKKLNIFGRPGGG